MSYSEIGDGLFMIDAHMFGAPENLSTYVIPDPIPTLIEPGPATCHDAVLAGLAEMGVDDIRQVTVTHIHLDHAGGAGYFLEAFPRADFFVHEVGAPHLARPEKLIRSATRIYGEDGMRDLWGPIVPIAPHRMTSVRDGDRIRIGDNRFLEVMYTPGHANHHISFVDSATGVVMIGDSVGITFPEMSIVHPVVPPPDIDVPLMIEQFDKYRERDVQVLGFAHFGLKYDVAEILEESERRLRSWTGIVQDHRDESDTELGDRIARWNRSDLVAHGHPHAHVERIMERTDFATEASGLLRYVHKHLPRLDG